jgi:hypothetical protein
MATDAKKNIKNIRQRRYLARDFDSFRSTLLDYARQYYPNQIQDFSEASVGGLFLDMASYVGDNMSYYMDHLYGELNYETAVENVNIERALINAGIAINGAAAATAPVTVYIEVPVASSGDTDPNVNLLPIIKQGTIFLSSIGVKFMLVEDIEFIIEPNNDGNYVLNPIVQKKIGRKRIDGSASTYVLSLQGTCVSGDQVTETFSIGEFEQFRKISLAYANVTEIIQVYDSYGNNYYEVGSLTHDVVYKNVLNTTKDNNLVRDSLKVIPAPYRFIKNTALNSRKTILTFGSGNASSLDDDIIPDPSEFAISFPYSKTFSRISINPEKLLSTNTLGTAAADTILTVIYRYGGGLDHNVSPGTITSISQLNLVFPKNPSNFEATKIKNSIEVINFERASGGEDALTSNELVALIPSVKNSQERIVTKEDLLARVYTMPANFGRVFRAAVYPNVENPLSAQLFIVSRNTNQELIISPDSLKSNLRKYLNSYRMISDAIDVLDSQIINLQLKFNIILDPSLNRDTVLASVLNSLQTKFDIKKMYIGQPIVISEVVNTIFTTQGVIAVDNVTFTNVTGLVNNKYYSETSHDIKAYTRNQLLYPPVGGIFEIRYPDVDIIAKVTV